jgi:hypothetical protein
MERRSCYAAKQCDGAVAYFIAPTLYVPVVFVMAYTYQSLTISEVVA